MKIRGFWQRQAPAKRHVIAGALLATLLGWAFLTIKPLGQGLRHWSYDLPFLVQADKPPEGACILSLDEESHRLLGQSPTNLWDRELHIQAMNRVFDLGAESVVFDIVFMEPWPEPDVDRRLAEAIRARGDRVVLAALLETYRNERGEAEFVTPFLSVPPLDAAAPWGVAEVVVDSDQTPRRHPAQEPYTNLAWRAAEVVGRAPSDPNRARWIRYYGPRGTVHRVPYHLVIGPENALPADYFAGQTVFVGSNPVLLPTGSDNHDEHATSFTWLTGETSTGVEIQATIFLNLIREDWIEEMPLAWQWILFTACGVVLGGGLTWFRPWISFWLALFLSVLGAVIAGLVFWGAGLWFPWLILGVVQLPAAFVWSVVTHSRNLATEKDELEERLQTSLRERSSMETETPATPQAAGSGRSAETAPAAPVVPDHELVRCVGRGAYGEVWLARDIIGTYHAVKIVYRKTFADERPFEREFQGIRKYTPISRTHPGLVHILHVGRHEEAGCFFYVMEAGDDPRTGQTIDPHRYRPKTLAGELQARRKLPLTECYELGIALADALEHLHRQGLIHRDIKPSNIIYLNGRPKFTDIGLVTEIVSSQDVTLVGTQGYLAPEGPISPASDVFALGKLLYEASLGQDPRAFPDWPTEMLEYPPTPEQHRFVALLWKACEPEPEKRFASAAALRDALIELRDES